MKGKSYYQSPMGKNDSNQPENNFNRNNHNFTPNNDYNNFNYDFDDKPKKSKKIILIIVGIIVLILIIVGGYFGKQKYDISSLNKKAENYADIEDYNEAIKVYTELFNKTGDVSYKSSINQMKLKKEIKDTLSDAKEQEQNGNLVKALVIYKMVPKEDEKSFKIAKNQIDSIKKDIITKASSLSDAGNSSQASSLLSEYISVEPNDKTALDLYKKVSGKNEQQTKEVIVNKTVPVYVNGSSSGGSASSIARAITGTYQYITSGACNVRSAPSKGASIIGNLHRGDSVYVYDTYVESESRIWCKTDAGWISYNTMNNTIR